MLNTQEGINWRSTDLFLGKVIVLVLGYGIWWYMKVIVNGWLPI